MTAFIDRLVMAGVVFSVAWLILCAYLAVYFIPIWLSRKDRK